jgi:hypothetical protein
LKVKVLIILFFNPLLPRPENETNLAVVIQFYEIN